MNIENIAIKDIKPYERNAKKHEKIGVSKMNNSMTIVIKNIKDIKPYEKNPRINDNAVDKVAESIKQFGWKVPIVIDKNNVIVTGHTRYKAAEKLGINEIPCIIANDLTDAQIKAYRIADNKVADFAIWDNKLLLEELADLDNIGEDIFTGFEIGDVFNVFDEKENSPIALNDTGFVYELVLKSEDKEKLKKIEEIWDKMNDGENTNEEK